MADNEKITVREARLSDKEAVLKIRDDIYGGRDYLMSYYDSFVRNDNCMAYVAIIDGEIVAFAALYLVDDKKAIVSRAGRINPKHVGKRLTYKMLEIALPQVFAHGVTHEYFTTNAGIKVMHKDSFKSRNRHILEKEGLSYLVEGNKWRSRTNTEQTHSLKRIPKATDSDLNRYISAQRFRDYLFPDDVIVVDWVPYKPLPSNLEIIKQLENTLILTDVREENDTVKGMVSIATVFKCSTHFYGCNLDIYGCDTSTFKQHLLQCVEYISSITSEPTSLVIFVDKQMNRNDLVHAADALGLATYKWVDSHDKNMYLNKLFLFESKL